MSSPIQPTQGTTQATAAFSAGGARRSAASFPLAPPAERAALDTFSASAPGRVQGRAGQLSSSLSSPPREVLDGMSTAARVHEGLRAIGRELHFAHDGVSGRITIEVRDGGGNVLRTLSPAEALDVAAGKPLE